MNSGQLKRQMEAQWNAPGVMFPNHFCRWRDYSYTNPRRILKWVEACVPGLWVLKGRKASLTIKRWKRK